MSVMSSEIVKVPAHANVDHIEVEFIYPYLVIFETCRYFRVIKLDKTGQELEDHDRKFQLDHEIVDRITQENFLWLVLKSGEFLVTDVINGSQMKVRDENYKIRQFQHVKNKLYVLSEGRESLFVPLTIQELNENFAKGVAEISVSLEKTRFPAQATDIHSHKKINGLNIYTENGDVIILCPVTGICERLNTGVNIDHIFPWGDMAIFANEANMWIVDMINSTVVHKYKNDETNKYLAVSVHNTNFYYLLWNKAEISICCSWNASMLNANESGNDFPNRSLTKISSQESLKAQMDVLVEAAMSSADPVQVIPQIKNLVDKLEDMQYLMDVTSKLCQYNTVYKSIAYSFQNKLLQGSYNDILDDLEDLMVKIDLVEYINFRGNNSYENFNVFEHNSKQLCITFISKSDFDLASICWLKYSEKKLNVTLDDVLDILNATPHNIKMGALVIWLRNFVPSLLDENPYFIDAFVKWTTQRVFTLEQSNYWPKIGMKFIDDIINVVERSIKTLCIRPISMDDLDILKDHINYIMELKDNYKINMLLGEISSQSPTEVALIMLRRCYTEDLEAFVQDYLPMFVTRYMFELDETLRSYIENEAASCGGGIDSSRLKILLNAIRTPTIKLECLLQVLKVLDVPWDPTVLDLAVSAASSVFKDFTVTDADRVLAHDIQKELNYAKVKVILKKYNFPLSCTDYNLVLHKLINAPVVDTNDLKVITSVMPVYLNYGNILYIDRCLNDNETKIALDFFNELSSKQKKALIKTVIVKYEQIINRDTKDCKIERNYLDFLKRSEQLNSLEIKDLENLYHLKNSYDMKLCMNTLSNEKYCSDIANEWIANGDDITASSGRGRCVIQLTCTTQTHRSELIGLLRRVSTNNQVRKIVEAFIMTFGKETTTAIAKVLHDFKNEENSLLLIECLYVLTELVINCNEEHLHYLLKYLSLLSALVNANIVFKNLSTIWKFHYIFLPVSSVSATNDLIESYTTFKDAAHVLGGANTSDFVTFRIISNIFAAYASNNEQLPVGYSNVQNSAVRKLISKVLASQHLDEVLLTNLILIMGTDDQYNHIDDNSWIIDTLQGQNETMPVALMGYLTSAAIRRTFALDNILPVNSASYPPQYILKSKFNINLEEISLPDNTEETWDVKVVLFYVLRQHPDTSFEKLVEICRTLNVAINDGLSLQLVSLLSTWELKYKVGQDDLGCRKLYLANDESELLAKCSAVWDSISDKTFLRDILNDFWKNGEVTLHGRLVSINPYYYEVYVCIYNLIHGSNLETRYKKEYFLLHFLKDYKRISTPKQYEFELFSVKGMFPEIGHFRLPFHLFMREDMWSNLKSEITLDTYERWLPAVALLSLDADSQTAQDMICSNALKQTMTSRKRSDTNEDNKESEPWRLTTREEPLLRAAHRCVKHIANMEWAGACLFYVLQGCARGADQVAAAQLCFQFGQRWAALQPGNRAVRQMERLHSTLSTRHALQKIEWAKEEFVRLSSEPTQLIRALYLHPEFVDKMARHDVNRAANEIADKNGINISSIRIQILDNILTRSNEEVKNNGKCGLDTKKLMTAKYILKATCPKMGAIYLSRIAFDDDSDFDKSKKLRALQCLMSIVEPDTALKVTNMERDALWISLLELLYVVNLENIDMPWIIATFMQDKNRALEQLLQNAPSNVECLKIAADLAHRFGSIKLIREMIPLLLRVALHDELIPLLLKVSLCPDDIIYTAWRAVLLTPFQKADYPITERQKSKCLNVINLLPVCPVIKDDDLLEIWKNCVRCKCFGLGCLVLPYISPDKRQTISELQKIDKRNLIASLKNLQAETYLVSGAMCVVESISSRVQR